MNEPASLDAAVDLGATSTTPTGTQSMAEHIEEPAPVRARR